MTKIVVWTVHSDLHGCCVYGYWGFMYCANCGRRPITLSMFTPSKFVSFASSNIIIISCYLTKLKLCMCCMIKETNKRKGRQDNITGWQGKHRRDPCFGSHPRSRNIAIFVVGKNNHTRKISPLVNHGALAEEGKKRKRSHRACQKCVCQLRGWKIISGKLWAELRKKVWCNCNATCYNAVQLSRIPVSCWKNRPLT